jgi:hypothetical protein
MTELSHAAQAVLDAFNSVPYYPDENDEGMLAAALRALAARGEAVEIRTGEGMAEFDDVIRTSDIVAIAAELDGAATTSEND